MKLLAPASLVSRLKLAFRLRWKTSMASHAEEATAVDRLFEKLVRPKSKGFLRNQPYFARCLEVQVLKEYLQIRVI